jgi:hypothetical protein
MVNEETPPSSLNRAYVIPHVVDAAGPIPGLRVIPNRLQAGDSTTVLIDEPVMGITLGWSSAINTNTTTTKKNPHSNFQVNSATKLAVTLDWVSAVLVLGKDWLQE